MGMESRKYVADTGRNIIDTRHNRTPLLFAAIGRREGIVKSLFAPEDINPNIVDTRCGRSPLGCATARGGGGGGAGVMGILFEREDINPKTVDTGYGRTPFLWAAQGGRAGILGLLWSKLIPIPTHQASAEKLPLN